MILPGRIRNGTSLLQRTFAGEAMSRLKLRSTRRPNRLRSNEEASILDRVVKPLQTGLPPDAARALLRLDFDDGDRRRMHVLSVKAQEGTLQAADEEELKSYRRIGYLVDLVRSRARLSLKKLGG
jgi:hypothetical protein